MRIRVDGTPSLNGQDLDAVRRIARFPVGQLDEPRRVLIRAMLRRGFTRQDVKQFLRLTDAQLVSETGAARASQAKEATNEDNPRNRNPGRPDDPGPE